MKKDEVRAYFKRITKNQNITDTEIALKLGTDKSNFSKFGDVLIREHRAWVLEWLWANRKPIPPELRVA
jgi:hypothetical protein